MSTTVLSTVSNAKAVARNGSTFRAQAARDWSEVESAWRRDQATATLTPFQNADWYSALYASIGAHTDAEPLIVSVTDTQSGQLAIRLPLVMRRERGLRCIEFADFELTDYNAPLIGVAAPTDAKGARHLWRAVLRALPPADVIRFRKMPLTIGGRPNPLALLSGIRPCSLNGNMLETGADWEAFRFARERTFRKELERSWRVFTRDPAARFNVVTEPSEIARVLSAMEEQQAARMRDVGADFALDGPMQAAFYRKLLAGIESGYPVLTALAVGDEIVAALLGICHRETFVMIRISNAGGQLKNISPGRLVIEQTMAQLHAKGFRRFDFSVGNYAYKRRFGVESLRLADFTQALSLKALPVVARDHLAVAVRKVPRAHQMLMRIVGKAPAREEA